MHPVIRVLAFLTLVALLSRATLFFIVVLDACFLLLSFRHLVSLRGTLWRSVIRLRWLWLSLLLLYGFMSPVTAPDSWQATLHISYSGLMLGLERCLALLTVILYFSWLNHVTGRTELQAAIYWLLVPLQRLGVPVARLSLRISLTLHAVAELQRQTEQDAVVKNRPARDWRQLPQRIYDLFNHALAQANRQDITQAITLDVEAPHYGQWLYLLVIVTLLVIGANLFSA